MPKLFRRALAAVLLLMFTAQARAADPLPDAPSATASSSGGAIEPAAAAAGATSEAAALVQPNAIEPYVVVIKPARKPVIDKQFIWAMSFASAASIADIESTAGFLKNPLCHESSSAWLVGQRPSRTRMYLTTAAIQAGVSTLSYYLKKKGKRFWWAPAAALGSAQLAAAGWNRFGSTCY
jgi:hypothetical protein